MTFEEYEAFETYINNYITQDFFTEVMLPHYGNDESYIKGIWLQFIACPGGFMYSRQPKEPGIELFNAIKKAAFDKFGIAVSP